MLQATRLVLSGILGVLLAPDTLAQQTRVVVPQPANASSVPSGGTAAITGSVIDARTNRPIAGAIVTLDERRPATPRQSSVQVTTATGRFAFVDLPASDTYFLTTTKQGYLDGGFGRPDPRGPSAPIALTAGQWMADVRVSMALPGSITGMVTDERNEPVVGAYVRVLPQVSIAGRVHWLAGPVARTDDRGVYRIAGLGPGKYIVSVPSVQATLPASATVRPAGAQAGTSIADLRAASEAARAEKLLVDLGGGLQLVLGRHAVPPPPTPDGRRTAYPIAFFPNVSVPSEATAIELGVSEDRLGIDIRLTPVSTARVSGVVQGPLEAIGNLQLRLIPVGLEELGQGSETATTVTLADGRFTFFDVPAGSYVLQATHTLVELTYTSMESMATALPAPVAFSTRMASSSRPTAVPAGVQMSTLRDWSPGYWGRVRVDVSVTDINDLRLPLRAPVTLSGRIVWAADGKPPGSFTPILEPADGRRSLGVLRPDGFGDTTPEFSVEGLMAGEYFLRSSGGAVIESIAWEGRDHTERPFDASEGRDITGVVVTVTSVTASISGSVRDAAAPLESGAAVIAFPVDPDRWSNYGLNPPRFKAVLTTMDGRFRIDGLPMGEYYVVAVLPAHERAWIDPAFLAAHAPRASSVRIDRRDAQIANLTLTLAR